MSGAPTASPEFVEITTVSVFIGPPLPVALGSPAGAGAGTACNWAIDNSDVELEATSTFAFVGSAGRGSAFATAEVGIGVSSGIVPGATRKFGLGAVVAGITIFEIVRSTGTVTGAGASTGAAGAGAAARDKRFAAGTLMRGRVSSGVSTTDGKIVGPRETRITCVGWKAS